MTQSVLIFAKRKNSPAEAAGQQLRHWLESRKYQVIDATYHEGTLRFTKEQNVKLGVVIGGDGTFLTLVRGLEDKSAFPILGVNLGTLGFITDFAREEMIASVEDALAGKYPEETRCLLQVEICRDNVCRISGTAFNDVVMNKDARTSMLKFDVSLGGEFMSYVRADGYIVATPTGSTAYGLSANGPLLHPGVGGVLLVPICPHSLSARPIVVPPTTTITITLRAFTGSVYLVLDGQINHEIDHTDQVKIHLAKQSLRLIRSPRQTWAQALRSKLDMA